MKWISLIALLMCVGCFPTKHEKNHLKHATNPYLQSLSQSPVWWYAWDKLPLKRAKEQDKLIFLSIGFSTCASCQKMRDEVYNNDKVAESLNKNYISIIIDKETRPDLDAYFLNMQSMIMKFGAWPINMILTPDLKPVFATTLLDNSSFLKVVNTSAKAWSDERHKILQGITQYDVQSAIQESKHPFYEKDFSLIQDYYARYTHQFDSLFGGRGVGNNFNNKFPVNSDMRLLLQHHLKTKENQPLQMVEKTLISIAQSALMDQLQGGFHRYSSSRDWNTPNYEKTLMDQASFLHAYVDIYSFNKKEFYRKTLEKLVKFLANVMQSPQGGFYAAMDSKLAGKDGFGFTWIHPEIVSSLTPAEMKLFNQTYFLNTPHQRFQKRSSLRRKTTFFKKGIEDVEDKLLQVREKRGEVFIDKKILTAENSYTLSGLSRLYRLWPSKGFYKIIEKNLTFLLNQHRTWRGELYRWSLNSKAHDLATLDDYAFLIDALIEFYQISFDESYIKLAKEMQDKQNDLFLNAETGAFRYSSSSENFLKELYLYRDQTQPSGQSMTFWNLYRLARFFHQPSYETQAKKLIDSYPDLLKLDPLAFPHLLLALNHQLKEPLVLSIKGQQEDCKEKSLEAFSSAANSLLVKCQNSRTELPKNEALEKVTHQLAFQACEKRSCFPPSEEIQKALKN